MEKIEALKKIDEAKNFREACWAIDDIAKETKDKKILLEVFNISEKLAEDFNDFRNLAYDGPSYWELFAQFYYGDMTTPAYCRYYERPAHAYHKPGKVCLDKNGNWQVRK